MLTYSPNQNLLYSDSHLLILQLNNEMVK